MGAPSHQRFRLDLTFFGYKREDRPKIHELLFDLVWAGEGRWDWDTVYNMPIWQREFWIKKINKIQDQRKQARDKAQKKSSPKSKIQKPGV